MFFGTFSYLAGSRDGDRRTGHVEDAGGAPDAIVDAALVGAVVAGTQVLDAELRGVLGVERLWAKGSSVHHPGDAGDALRVRLQDRAAQGHGHVARRPHVLQHRVYDRGVYNERERGTALVTTTVLGPQTTEIHFTETV